MTHQDTKQITRHVTVSLSDVYQSTLACHVQDQTDQSIYKFPYPKVSKRQKLKMFCKIHKILNINKGYLDLSGGLGWWFGFRNKNTPLNDYERML